MYELDEMTFEHGHEIIRLSPYHCQYNSIQLISAQIKQVANQIKNFKIKGSLNFANQALNSINAQVWEGRVHHVKRLMLENCDKE